MKSLKQRQQLEGYLAEYDPRMRYAEKELEEEEEAGSKLESGNVENYQRRRIEGMGEGIR